MKSGIQGVRSSVGSDQCAKIFVWNPLPAVQSSVWQRHSWHGLLLLLLHTSTKGTMMLLSLIGALHLDHLEVPDQGVLMNFLVHLHFSKESSTTCCYLPPLLSETRDHLWYNVIASWTHAQSVLYRCNSQRGLEGFEAVQLWSHKSTFKIYLKSQILNLFEMSNISNLFEMSSSTSVWNLWYKVIASWTLAQSVLVVHKSGKWLSFDCHPSSSIFHDKHCNVQQTLTSLHHISDCSQYISNNDNVMDFRDRKKAILRAKSRPLWQAGSRVGSPTCIVLWTK